MMQLLIKYGWYALLVAVVGEMVLPFILALFYKGYQHTTMVISSLGNSNSPVRMPFNLWMLLAGILFLLSIPSILDTYGEVSKPLSIATTLFITVFAIGACIFSCFFSVNETKDIVTTASKIHGVGSVIGFMLFFVLFVMSDKQEFQNTVIANEGLWQRLNMLFMYLPMGYISIKNF